MADRLPIMQIVTCPRRNKSTIVVRAHYKGNGLPDHVKLEKAPKRWQRLHCGKCGSVRSGVVAYYTGKTKRSTLYLCIDDLTWADKHKCRRRRG